MRGWLGSVVAGAGALGAVAAIAAVAVPAPTPGPTIADQRRRLIEARAAAAAAAARVAATRRAADAEAGAAGRARAQRLAKAAEVAAAQADFATARVRVALVAHRLGDQRARLAAGEAPVARLLGALLSLARRPAVTALAQPGSVDDLVHLRAVLGSVAPVIRARTGGLRAELGRTRQLEGDATLAAAALARTRRTLDGQRAALAALEEAHGDRAQALGRDALTQGDRAIALGEAARDIVDRIAEAGGQQATLAELEMLPGPPAPAEQGAAPTGPPVYRLPVSGRLVTGFGELSAAGVRARGLTLAVAPRAPAVAPAAGRIAYAGPFRGYGRIVIIDHGAGWTSLVTGLASVAVTRGSIVPAGARVGTAPAADAPLVTVELRRRGRPIDPVGLI